MTTQDPPLRYIAAEADRPLVNRAWLDAKCTACDRPRRVCYVQPCDEVAEAMIRSLMEELDR